MKSFVNVIRYLLMFFILISCLAAIVVLGLDLDLLLNGPDYLSKVISNIVNRLHQEEIVNQEQLTEVLLDARQSLWVHIPMLMIMVISIVMLFLNCLGCAGACLLSYSLLSGFTMVMFVNMVLYLCLALWIFVNNMEDSVMDSYVSGKISQYHHGEGVFNMVIDTVQRDLQCCGFKSLSDWSGNFPPSCCPGTCDGQGVECLQVEKECMGNNVYTSTCLEMIRSNLLEPGSMIGAIGLSFLVAVAVVGVTTILSFFLCISARRSHNNQWSPVEGNSTASGDGSNLELTSPKVLKNLKA